LLTDTGINDAAASGPVAVSKYFISASVKPFTLALRALS